MRMIPERCHGNKEYWAKRQKVWFLAQMSPVIALPFCLEKVSRPQHRGGGTLSEPSTHNELR